MSSRSPASWPRLSLTSLNRSRSKNTTATAASRRGERWSAWVRRSLRSARFGSPVSSSWKARCSSSSRACACSIATAASETTRSTSGRWTVAVDVGRVEQQGQRAGDRVAVRQLDRHAPARGRCRASPRGPRSAAARRSATDVGDEDLLAIQRRAPRRHLRVDGNERDPARTASGGKLGRRREPQRVAVEQPDQAEARAGVRGRDRRGPIEDALERLAPRDHLQDPRLLGEQLVERLAIGDVADVDDHARDRRVVEAVRDRHRLPVPATVGVPDPGLDVRRLVGVLEHPRPGRRRPRRDRRDGRSRA